MEYEISHPATNGSTKEIIKYIVWILGIIAFISVILIGVLNAMLVKDHHTERDFIATDVSIGTVLSADIAGLVYALKSFFDTRKASEKSDDKLRIIQEKHKARQERYKEKLNYKLKKKGKL